MTIGCIAGTPKGFYGGVAGSVKSSYNLKLGRTVSHMKTDLKFPNVGQNVRLVRPVYYDDGMSGYTAPVGLTGTVIEVDSERKMHVIVEWHEFQATPDLQAARDFVVNQFRDDRYNFTPTAEYEINGMSVGGLLEFHLCCEYCI